MRHKLLLAFTVPASAANAAPGIEEFTAEGTFSIIARDATTGELGMAVQSKAHAVGSRTISAKGGVGIIAHQATRTRCMARSASTSRARHDAEQALEFMVRADEDAQFRQVSILDLQGRTASWTGRGAQDWKGQRCTSDYCVQGNILVGPEVLDGMVKSFEAAAGRSCPSGSWPRSTAGRPRAATGAACRRRR
jgi:uncharacterized Ntn-hydrolase superfamily protein